MRWLSNYKIKMTHASWTWHQSITWWQELSTMHYEEFWRNQPAVHILPVGNSIIPSVALQYNGVIISALASQITASRLFTQPFIQAQIKEYIKSSASVAFVRGIHRWPVNSPHKGPVTRNMFPFDGVIMLPNIQWVQISRIKCHCMSPNGLVNL